MDNEDFSQKFFELKSARKQTAAESLDIFEKIQQDFDDISSIYTDNQKLSNLEDTLKRIKQRDVQIEQLSHRDHITELNN